MKAFLCRVFLVVDFTLSSLYIYHSTPFWPAEFLLKSQLMRVLLYVTCCFSLAAFNILSLSLIFAILITVCLFKKHLFIYLFIFGCVGSLFLHGGFF